MLSIDQARKFTCCITGAYIVGLLSLFPATDACALGEACPDYHREDKALGARVKTDLKRNARSEGVPERLLYLYDQLADCPACLGGDANNPILPYIFIVFDEDAEMILPGFGPISHRGTAWNADQEYAARQGMRDGTVKAYYILLEDRGCECCTATTEAEFDAWDAEGDPDPTDSPDYNDELDIDVGLSYSEDDPDSLGPDPQDLTEIDDKDLYPDQIPMPPLNIRPSIRPLTTGCDACQPLVNEYNDLIIRINAQHLAVAYHERRVKILEIAMQLALRPIRAHAQKAQDEDWEAERDRLDLFHGGLIANHMEFQIYLKRELAILEDLKHQRELLREAILECEAHCALLDTQPEPVIAPEEPRDEAQATLPPYVRIASQACSGCKDALEKRNNLARKMNALVAGLIDTGFNASTIEAWNTLRIQLSEADSALRECVKRCTSPELPKGEVTISGTGYFGAPTTDCPPCRELQKKFEHWRQKGTELGNQYGNANIKRYGLEARRRNAAEDSNPEERRQLDEEIRRAHLELRRLDRLRRKAWDRAYKAKLELEYCKQTQCLGREDVAPRTDATEEAFNYGRFWIKKQRYFFVGTSCVPCYAKVQSINAWVKQAHDEWLTLEFMESMALRKYQVNDESAAIAARYRMMAFLEDLQILIDELRACEKEHCPLTHGDQSTDAYTEPNIGSATCVDDVATKPAVLSGVMHQPLPDACEKSWLERWFDDCDADCTGVGDIAIEDGTPASDSCNANGAPIGGFVAELGLDVWFSQSLITCGFSPAALPDGAELGRERNLLGLPSSTPDDPFYRSSDNIASGLADQWAAVRIGSLDGIGMDSTNWVTGSQTIVAVVDSGIDGGQPELDGALWTNISEIPANGFDDDHNGYTDDVAGWNFVHDDSDVTDRNGHGTMVAGIVAANSNNGVGIAGINPWAKIMPLKVMNYVGRGNSVDIAAAITYAVNERARVINVSLGGAEFSQAERVAVAYAQSKDVLVVVAAGNTGIDASDYWPAGLDNVITVAATEADDSRARYSNWGSPVDIAAPGTDILSLRARYTDLMYFVEDDYPRGRNIVGADKLLYHATGTSFAAPFVSGVASLLFSLNPELSAQEVRRMILHSARDIETPGIDTLTGFGLLDARAAMAADADYFIDAGIDGVSTANIDRGLVVQVLGTADADEFASAEIQFAQGENPDDWKSAGAPLKLPVHNGVLGEIAASELRGAPLWTLRVLTTHVNGSMREARYALSLQ